MKKRSNRSEDTYSICLEQLVGIIYCISHQKVSLLHQHISIMFQSGIFYNSWNHIWADPKLEPKTTFVCFHVEKSLDIFWNVLKSRLHQRITTMVIYTFVDGSEIPNNHLEYTKTLVNNWINYQDPNWWVYRISSTNQQSHHQLQEPPLGSSGPKSFSTSEYPGVSGWCVFFFSGGFFCCFVCGKRLVMGKNEKISRLVGDEKRR